MKTFFCGSCGQLVFFENTFCERCKTPLGYAPDVHDLLALEVQADAVVALGDASRRYRFCENRAHGVCNWLIPDEAEDDLCLACAPNAIIPDLSLEGHLKAWAKLESAKHRVFYSLLRFGLPIVIGDGEPGTGMGFRFLAPDADAQAGPVLTGHNRGLITVNLREADASYREGMRQSMGERYRTLIGHFRHELGHYYWEQLILPDPQRLEAFRATFGDEREDYAQALQKHYEQGPPADWNTRYLSAYAAAHPWEDWAECWAHTFHLVDTLETAYHLGLSLTPRSACSEAPRLALEFDPYQHDDFEAILKHSQTLALAANSLNRSMGQPDLYPFVLSAPVLDKLRFVHGTIRGVTTRPEPAAA